MGMMDMDTVDIAEAIEGSSPQVEVLIDDAARGLLHLKQQFEDPQRPDNPWDVQEAFCIYTREAEDALAEAQLKSARAYRIASLRRFAGILREGFGITDGWTSASPNGKYTNKHIAQSLADRLQWVEIRLPEDASDTPAE